MTTNYSYTWSALLTTVSTVIVLAIFTPAIPVLVFVYLALHGAL